MRELATGEKRHSCNACAVSYRRQSDLRNHVIRSHLKQKHIKCTLCPETFAYHIQRKHHMNVVHTHTKPDVHTCDLCKKGFKRKNTLADHMMDVHIEKQCTKCELKLVRRKYLFHLNEAHGAPMPTCGICGLRTLKQSALVRHQRNVHLNEKHIPCVVCGKRFRTQFNLQDHMITHNPRRKFKCQVCGKCFARKECYKSHSRLHTGERPFCCSVCGVSFAQRASLRFHLKSHHPGVVARSS